MVNKYARLLEERIVNDKTGMVWAIQDVPRTWLGKTETKVLNDGYVFDEDGTAYPNVPNEEA